jgi:hypothetical protein
VLIVFGLHRGFSGVVGHLISLVVPVRIGYFYYPAQRRNMKEDRTSNDLEVDLLWYKDSKGYALEDYGRYGRWVVRRGGELVPIHPLRGGFAFKAFSNVSSRQDLVDFVNIHGFLENAQGSISGFFRSELRARPLPLIPTTGSPSPQGEDVDEHLKAAAFFRRILGLRARRIRSPDLAAWLQDVSDSLGEVQIVADKGGWFRPVLKPTSLMGGMLLQLVSSVGRGAEYRLCKHCGAIFEVGPGAGRRADAKFCSDEHKIVFNSRRRSL